MQGAAHFPRSNLRSFVLSSEVMLSIRSSFAITDKTIGLLLHYGWALFWHSDQLLSFPNYLHSPILQFLDYYGQLSSSTFGLLRSSHLPFSCSALHLTTHAFILFLEIASSSLLFTLFRMVYMYFYGVMLQF